MRASSRKILFATTVLLCLGADAAAAQEAVPATIRIGVAAPLSGAPAILGAQVVAGVEAAAAGKPDIAVTPADTECTSEGGARAAAALVAAKADIVAGFLCTEALEAAWPVLTAAGIPILDVGVRANRFTDRRAKTGALVWRVGPRSDAEAETIAKLLVARWRDVPFGLVDDGTIYGRGLVDAVRSRLEAAGMRPATIDTFRPAEEKQFGLVRRIAGTGVTRLFVAGDRPDVATIARDAASLDLGLEFVGGETLLDEADPALPLPEGILAVAPLERFPELARDGAESPEGYFGPAHAAAEIAIAAVRQARAASRPLPAILNETTFTTALGPVRFDAEGDSDLDLMRVFRFDGKDFVPEAGG